MACQLKEAIEYLSKFSSTKKLLQNILDNDKNISTAYGELIQDNYKKSPNELSLQEFGKGLSALIKNVTNVTIKNSKEFGLAQIKVAMEVFNPARFSINDGIEITDITNEEVSAKIKVDYYEKLVNGTLPNIGKITTESDMYAVLDVEVSKALTKVVEAKGGNFLQHELIHAGALEYMSLSPNEPASKRISDIYTYLYSNHKALGLKEGYWKTDVNEFIAEAISNAEVISALLQIKTQKPVKRLSNIYDEVINTILSMLGYKGKKLDNLFDVLLDSTLKMLEEKGMLPESRKGTSKPQTASEGKSTRWSGKSASEAAMGDSKDAKLFHLSPGDTNQGINPFTSDPKYRQYSAMYSNKIIEVIAPTIIKNSEFLTRQFSEGYLGHIVLGEYKPLDNTVFLAELIEDDISMVLSNQYNQGLEAKSGDATTDDYKIASGNAAIIKDYVNNQDANYIRFHELVHAGSVSYMLTNPEDKLTKRIEELYLDVMQNGNPDMDALWTKNKEEFLAEGMSNPEVIKMLMSIKPKTPVKYFMNAFDVLIDTALSMLGLKGKRKGTIHDYLVDTFTAMILEQEKAKQAEADIKQASKDKREGNGEGVKWTPELTELWRKASRLPKARISEFSDTELAIEAGNAVREEIKTIVEANKGLGAATTGLNEVIISDEEYQAIKESNQYYKDKHPKMFSFGDEYRFHDDTNTITLLDPSVESDVDEQMHEVYTAHEIAHALTWEYLNDPANKDTVTYLKNALKVAKRDFEPGFSLEENLLADRLKYASTDGFSDIRKVAELVAILSSEPNIRKSFIEAFPQTTRSKLEKVLDVIKAFIAKNIGMEYTDDVIATVDAIIKAGKINPVHRTNSTSRGIGAIEALGSANKEADDMYMELYQPTTVSVNNARTEEVVGTTPKQKVQMYFNGSKSGEAREVKKVSVKDNMLTLELVKGGTYQFDLDGRVTNGLHTGIAPEGSAKVKSIQANLRAILQSIEVPAIMPTQISKEAMLEAKAIIAEAKKKCEG